MEQRAKVKREMERNESSEERKRERGPDRWFSTKPAVFRGIYGRVGFMGFRVYACRLAFLDGLTSCRPRQSDRQMLDDDCEL